MPRPHLSCKRRLHQPRYVPRKVPAALCSALCLLVGSSFLAPADALANVYHGLLHGGTLSITSNTASESGGYIYGDASWTSPSGTVFNGLAYTSAYFSSISDNAVGGVSAGFGGDGSANQPYVLFPGADDCSITNSGHYWTNTWGATLAGTNGLQSCNIGGNGGSWTYANAEIENTNPGVNPQTVYRTLWLTVFCQAGTCNYDPNRQWGTGGVSVTNLSGSVIDPSDQPAGSASWAPAVNGASWYQTNSGALALNLTASDPAGVCALYAYLTGPATVQGGLVGNQNPGVVDVGGAIGQEFASGVSPCWAGQTDQGTWTVPGSLPSGTYDLHVAAANPGNYEAQGFSANGSPTVASYGNAVNIDDTVPSLSWSGAPQGWTSSTSETLNVTVGPSGVASVSCTDNGGNVAATLISGSTTGAGTTSWRIPTPITGSNSVSCTASNGDSNGALAGAAAQTFEVDPQVPVITLADSGYSEGAWTARNQAVVVSATAGPGGMHDVSCSVDTGALQQLASASGGEVAVSGDGEHVLRCVATSTTGVRGTATYTVNIDTRQPTLSFLVNGAAPNGDWFSGTPVVTVIGSEDGGILSGLSRITCSVNGGAPFDLGGISAASGYTGSFELAQNGSDKISCTATTVAGTAQTTPATATVNVDNPNYSPSASSLIDNGNDPYSNGPSQAKWYVTPQSVTITADNTGGSAPIAAISCKGALSGNWPISNLNRDSAGGEQITVTVSAPGGDLSCTAEDAAGNVYVLGSYLFQIDDTPPTGYFVPRAKWPAPDAIEIHATDNGGSGVALVRVYGESPDVEQGQPQLVGDARYDTSTGEYVVTLPDGVSPWVAANWTFYANIVDVAGNQGRVTAGADGSTEDLTLPLREDTSVTARAERVAATPEPAIPGALASAAGLPGQASAAIARRVRPARARAATAARSRRRDAAAGIVRVAYGRTLTITGTLTDLTHQGTPISGSEVVIYEQIKGAGSYTRVGSVITNRAGSYRYRVPPGASRTLYVVYPGSAELRPAASRMFVRSAGSVSLRASRIEAGGELVIDGQVRGGYIPHGGLEVTIDYRQLGAPGSGTLGTVHTDPRGDFRFTQHFSRDTRGLRYQLWAVVPRDQPGWPYSGASTPPVLRRVG